MSLDALFFQQCLRKFVTLTNSIYCLALTLRNLTCLHALYNYMVSFLNIILQDNFRVHLITSVWGLTASPN